MGYYDRYPPNRYQASAGSRSGRPPSDYDHDDRDFFDRASDEVRSWFGDEEAERRRRWDARQDDYPGGFRDEGPRGPSRDRYQGYGPYGQRGEYASRPYRNNFGGREMNRGSMMPRSGGGFSWSGRQGEAGWRGGDVDWEGHSDYQNWRDHQISLFDQDYDEYRRERQHRFNDEFGTWRQRRFTQREALGQVREHMDVIGSDGQHVGQVDHVRDNRIQLTKTDADAHGRHHYVPCSWIDAIDGDNVRLNLTADQAHQSWTAANEESAARPRADAWNR